MNAYNVIAGYTPPTAPPAAPAPGIGATMSAIFTYDPTTKLTTVVVNAPNTNAVTGAFVLVANAPAAPNMVGRIFRLGSVPPNTAAGSGTFYLQPGSDITDADIITSPTSFPAGVFIIGAAPTIGANGEYTGPYTGPNQDIAASSAFIRVNLSNN
jgi:hypothetical protein